MAGKKGQDNTKKVAGNARKAESAAKKSAAADADRENADGEKWQQGAKNNLKKYVRGTMVHGMASLRMPSLYSPHTAGYVSQIPVPVSPLLPWSTPRAYPFLRCPPPLAVCANS